MAQSHAAHGAAEAHAAGDEGGHASVATYVRVAVVLTVVTAIEVATLYIPGLPKLALVTGLILMSILKFALVVGFYMHLRYDSKVFTSMFVGPLLIAIGIILALMALFSAFILLPR